VSFPLHNIIIPNGEPNIKEKSSSWREKERKITNDFHVLFVRLSLTYKFRPTLEGS
jgi:hypothetical protein